MTTQGKNIVQRMTTDSGKQVVVDNTNNAAITTFPAPVSVAQTQDGTRGTWFKTEGKPRATVWFLGTGNENGTVNYRVYLHCRTSHDSEVGYLPKFIGGGVATLSTYTAAVAGVGTVTDRLADTITDTSGLARLTTHSPADNTPAYVEFDTEGAEYIEIMTDLGANVTKASALCQLGDEPRFFRLQRLLGGINDATTDSLNGKIGTDTEMLDSSLFDLITQYCKNDGWRVAKATISRAPDMGAEIFALITGVIEAKVFGVVKTGITGTGAETLSVGEISGSGKYISATTATDLGIDEIWHDASPDSSQELMSVASSYIMVGAGFVLTQSGPSAWTSGEIEMYILWRPISADGNVNPADLT